MASIVALSFDALLIRRAVFPNKFDIESPMIAYPYFDARVTFLSL